MMWYSTADSRHRVSFRDAVLQGLAPRQGLYMPEGVPALSDSFFRTAAQLTFQEQAFEIARAFLADDIEPRTLRGMIDATLTFDAPLVEIESQVFALELFHGPTLAFKDVGARFMSQLLAFYAREIQQEIIVLVATSGDTGGAVANGFYNVPGVRVVILYPSKKVTELQERQFTTLGKNITALEIDGTFDDCQRLVKTAFTDSELTSKFFLTSANSINVGRLLPQIFYYVYAWSRAPENKPLVFAVPSGNFGNLMAGLFAHKMGLPGVRFIAATNANDAVPAYLESGRFQARRTIPTISSAMDVGNPSNFERILALYEHDHQKIKEIISGYSFSDAETAGAIQKIFHQIRYVLDPHGAVAYLGLIAGKQKNETGIFLETAHPAKFKETAEKVLKTTLALPATLQQFSARPKHSVMSSSDFAQVKQILAHTLLQQA